MENVRKHRDIELATTDTKSNYLVSKPKYHTTTFFSESLVPIEMERKKMQILVNKPVYLCLSILEISKIVMYEFGMIPKTKVWRKR